MESFFSKRNYAIAIAILGGYNLVHWTLAATVFVGVPALFLGLYPSLSKSPIDRKLEKHIESINNAMNPHLRSLAISARRIEDLLREATSGR